ncbi:hypothetical protein KEK_14578 [Mycolicibacterium thermoresistibile ATCC 19527]|uniref:Ferredoxin n=3 Tax=Mycolicibacterium thermoresistibile TaxID=1797 RepID=G7CH23_MYCT3|nr:hypothetical protein KEK_14578 [Mycolicibacterium thermoresistibile ATCC 19527]GAT15500.1 putative uncharacterized protein [Mycolicibacterium thermoresistibile]SNW16949.1 ferredoxin [Mycolicibacterium thermoresistibile]
MKEESMDTTTKVGRLYVEVDQSVCQGHALCHRALPEVFLSDDETGLSYTTNEPVPPELEDEVKAAASNCPERAIRLRS